MDPFLLFFCAPKSQKFACFCHSELSELFTQKYILWSRFYSFFAPRNPKICVFLPLSELSEHFTWEYYGPRFLVFLRPKRPRICVFLPLSKLSELSDDFTREYYGPVFWVFCALRAQEFACFCHSRNFRNFSLMRILFLISILGSTRISKVCLASPTDFGHLYIFWHIFFRFQNTSFIFDALRFDRIFALISNFRLWFPRVGSIPQKNH